MGGCFSIVCVGVECMLSYGDVGGVYKSLCNVDCPLTVAGDVDGLVV